MKSFLYSTVVLALLVCGIGGCSSKIPSSYNSAFIAGKPHWYWNPSSGGVIGGIGEAGFHVDGASAQRRLAVSRAIDDIALQKGVSINYIQEIRQTGNDEKVSLKMESYSVQTVQGVVINAQVQEVWLDPATGRLVVWVTESY